MSFDTRRSRWNCSSLAELALHSAAPEDALAAGSEDR